MTLSKIEKCARLMGIVYSEVIGGRLVLHDSNGLGHFTTAEEAKKRVELATNHWIDNAVLQKGQP